MSEFNNRIDAQRAVLRIVNSKRWDEELLGLSNGAIERWMRANRLNAAENLSLAIYEAADKLFFLANKSQEQITEEYRMLSVQVSDLTDRIARLMQERAALK
ncbi:hypothetical protein ABIB42_004322 [Massilia sp. UYP32]|jgi:hypothetical protein|uniref:hypothetical protein n=1 Tax=Massilia TaxID=149698 RepID=UPI0009DA464E|nr:hypothetical protein [Massilia timonae]